MKARGLLTRVTGTMGRISSYSQPGNQSEAVATQTARAPQNRPTEHGSSGNATETAGANGAPQEYAVYADGRHYHRGTPAQRFWARVIQGATADECWDWKGSKLRDTGYGRLGIAGKRVDLAHRFSWELHFGDIPDGACVLHSCDNPPCSNPRHLFLGTRADNYADMRRKGRENRAGYFSSERFARERHPRAKITREDAEAIRDLYRPRHTTCKELASRYGISEHTVRAIVAGRLWKIAAGGGPVRSW